MSDVGTWLAEIGLGQYADAFEANDVVHSARSDRRRSISNARKNNAAEQRTAIEKPVAGNGING